MAAAVDALKTTSTGGALAMCWCGTTAARLLNVWRLAGAGASPGHSQRRSRACRL